MAGKGPSAEQLRKELRKTLKLFVRHRATSSTTKDGRNQAEAPPPPPLSSLRCMLIPEAGFKTVASRDDNACAQYFSLAGGFNIQSEGASLSLRASSSAGLPAAKAVESRHEKGLFSYEFGEAASELQDEQDESEQDENEQDETFDTVARELDAIATAVNERYGCWNSQDGEPQTKGYFLSAVSGLVSGAAATFRVAVAQCVHSELPEMHQLALLFHVAATAVQQVGSDVYKAQRITDITVDYAYDKYGDYIAANGGLGNAIKDS